MQKGLDKVEDIGYGIIPMMSATRYNNGISGYVDEVNRLFACNTITVVSNGASTGEVFYQSLNYCATGDANILKPKFNLNIYSAMFIISLIRLDQYKFSYGRKWGKARMEISVIKLPAIRNKNGNHEPDFELMENYIKSLPYSSNL
ncbi:MAG TPA: restriction endonuclease subunit S [Rickettsia endosymbiont of Degeeriella rufa]|nr:restriction endonuclease subunit S [Rickettsia endosymbiont of Degeeriella rufa]